MPAYSFLTSPRRVEEDIVLSGTPSGPTVQDGLGSVRSPGVRSLSTSPRGRIMLRDEPSLAAPTSISELEASLVGGALGNLSPRTRQRHQLQLVMNNRDLGKTATSVLEEIIRTHPDGVPAYARQMETDAMKLELYRELLTTFFEKYDKKKVQNVALIVRELDWDQINTGLFQQYGDTAGRCMVAGSGCNEDEAASVAKLIAFYRVYDPSREYLAQFMVRKLPWQILCEHLRGKYGADPDGMTVQTVTTLPPAQLPMPGPPPPGAPWERRRLVSRRELGLIDAWIVAKQLNEFGDAPGTVYGWDVRGPDFDRVAYILRRHPTRPWVPTRLVAVAGTGSIADGSFGYLVVNGDASSVFKAQSDSKSGKSGKSGKSTAATAAALRMPAGFAGQLHVGQQYAVILDTGGTVLGFDGAHLDYFHRHPPLVARAWACGGAFGCCCCLLFVVLLALGLAGVLDHLHSHGPVSKHTHASDASVVRLGATATSGAGSHCANGRTDAGVETGLDCGGACAAAHGKRCARNVACAVNADCASSWCHAGKKVCWEAPKVTVETCGDYVENQRSSVFGGETDVDCGGVCRSAGVSPPQRCGIGRKCLRNEDCMSMICEDVGAATSTTTSASRMLRREGAESTSTSTTSTTSAATTTATATAPGQRLLQSQSQPDGTILTTTHNRPCVFPFKFRVNGVAMRYTSCTMDDPTGAQPSARPWCATRVDADGFYKCAGPTTGTSCAHPNTGTVYESDFCPSGTPIGIREAVATGPAPTPPPTPPATAAAALRRCVAAPTPAPTPAPTVSCDETVLSRNPCVEDRPGRQAGCQWCVQLSGGTNRACVHPREKDTYEGYATTPYTCYGTVDTSPTARPSVFPTAFPTTFPTPAAVFGAAPTPAPYDCSLLSRDATGASCLASGKGCHWCTKNAGAGTANANAVSAGQTGKLDGKGVACVARAEVARFYVPLSYTCTSPPPTAAPTPAPSPAPTGTPTAQPTSSAPSFAPTKVPTNQPTFKPTAQPTFVPTELPTNQPTFAPTKAPTQSCTAKINQASGNTDASVWATECVTDIPGVNIQKGCVWCYKTAGSNACVSPSNRKTYQETLSYKCTIQPACLETNGDIKTTGACTGTTGAVTG